MKSEGGDREMKCPKCGRYSLHVTGKGVGCRTCGYELSPGETDKYRLFQVLKEEEKKPR